ncbi:hypothetical protein HIM_09692 [Hirsutella minnesotensis 3608]|uniref:Uncharacterized protein n=1 Tax=Hirsutella minnesotensis 3608 TaxID=1043627 RepID=A0A0F8A2Y7_9HYPO|nr:hypothetical protein HIM_09692 [Hirsutella minnesotensis 3608]
MLFGAIISASLFFLVSAQDDMGKSLDEKLATKRIEELTKRYQINWDDPPSLNNKRLNRNVPHQVSVYVQRHVDHSYINPSKHDDKFTLTTSTTVFRDITVGSTTKAQSTTGGEFGHSLLKISAEKSDTATNTASKNNSTQLLTSFRYWETCKAGHACRFETWTFYVQIKGHCGGSPCEMRNLITNEDGQPLTEVVYFPEQLPSTDWQSISGRLKADLQRKFCIDWDNPPRRDYVFVPLYPGDESGTSVSPFVMQNKRLKVSIELKRNRDRTFTSGSSGNTPVTINRSNRRTEKTTDAWNVAATSTFGVTTAPDYKGASLKISYSKEKSEEKFNTTSQSLSKADMFSIKATCEGGRPCAFETWTFYAKISGICRAVNTNLQTPCELNVPIGNGGGLPISHSIKIYDNLSEEQGGDSDSNATQTDESADSPVVETKAPKALGYEKDQRNFCLLDTFEYYRVRDGKYFSYSRPRDEDGRLAIDFYEKPGAPKPSDTRNCREQLPDERPATGIMCYGPSTEPIAAS